MSDTSDDMEAGAQLYEYYLENKPKRRKIMETITVEAATKEPKIFNDEKSWGVKVGKGWMDLHVEQRPVKGESFNVEIEDVEWKGKTYRHARVVKGAAQPTPPAQTTATQTRPAPSLNGNRASAYTQPFDSWESIARRAHSVARELEPGIGDARARFAFVASFLIAFGDGKLTDTAPPADDWTTVATPAKQETNAAHIELEKTLDAYAKKFNRTAKECSELFPAGKTYVRELSEHEAIQARLEAQRLIDGSTDYKAELTALVKAHFVTLGLDFSDRGTVASAKKADILSAIGIVGPFKDVLNMQAKDALIKFREKYLLDPLAF